MSDGPKKSGSILLRFAGAFAWIVAVGTALYFLNPNGGIHRLVSTIIESYQNADPALRENINWFSANLAIQVVGAVIGGLILYLIIRDFFRAR
jgi:hypothetical protein